MADTARKLYIKRAQRTRTKLAKVAGERPRLSVFRSSKNIAAQIIDDKTGKTIVSASSLDKDLREAIGRGSNKDAAAQVGKALAERAKGAGVAEVVFDRGGYIYHGRVKALAEAAREAGLNF
ncbi:MAG TPA: 50S ribosomal protein L18 [Parvularculaceae bacterium]|nr:50S ribosomal protein L18 [Parvularculaceae bacterium]